MRKYAATTKLNEIIRDVRQRMDLQTVDVEQLVKAIIEGDTIKSMDQPSMVKVYFLCQWCLQGKKEGNGYGFPFDRPLLDFAGRIKELKDFLPSMQNQIPQNDKVGFRLFTKLSNLVKKICADKDFTRAVADLKWRSQLFDDLRDKMRIARPAGRQGLNDEGSHKSMTSIRNGVRQFRLKLGKKSKYRKDILCQKLAKQIDKYDEKLFADPIEVNTPSGKMFIYPQRTNNLLEQFFRSFRRNYRRKTGNNSMHRSLRAILADAPLIKNLDNPEYMNLLLNGKSNLEELFAELEETGKKLISSTHKTDHVLPGLKKLIKIKNLPEKLLKVFEECA